jgi:hypothetical protein
MKTNIHRLIFILWGVNLLGACTKFGVLNTQSVSAPTRTVSICGEIDNPQFQIDLVTPYAIEPAAGICGGPLDGGIATVNIWPDVPEPRCLVVASEQILQVTNKTGEFVKVQLGPFGRELGAGETYTFDCPMGYYLAPGVHQLMVSPFGSPEIWLKE